MSPSLSRRTCAHALGSSLVAALAALCFAGPTLADVVQLAAAGDSGHLGGEAVGQTHEVVMPDPEKEEAYRTAWAEYGKSVGNRYLVGLNSLITFPADPVMDTVKPREEFDKLPLSMGTKYIAGFFTGVMLSMYRVSMGAFDVVCAPLTPMKMLSPEPRWMIFPGAHHDEF
jgi:hypothetical protein